MLRIGTAKRCITPDKPLVLGGFDFRTTPFEEVGRDIYLRAITLNGHHAILSLELLFVGDNLDALIRDEVSKHAELRGLTLQICATHSHSSFQTANYQSPRLGSYDEDYCKTIAKQAVDALRHALMQQTELRVFKSEADCFIAINRRKKLADGSIEMAPNPDGLVDRTATILRFEDDTGITRAVLVHNHCHPTITGDNVLSGEYPGIISDRMEQHFPEATCLVLQGFCGDVRPALIKDGAFYRGTFEEVAELGEKLADTYISALEEETRLKISEPVLFTQSLINLPVKPIKSKDELEVWAVKFDEESIQREWAMHRLELAHVEANEPLDQVQLRATALNLGGALGILTLSGEVVSEYNRYLKELHAMPVLCVGYCNGMLSYVPTEEQIAEGGYEPELSAYYFYMPSTFAHSTETILKRATTQLLQRVGVN